MILYYRKLHFIKKLLENLKNKDNQRHNIFEMRKIIYLLLILFSLSMFGQTENFKKDFRVDLLVVEKNTKDTLIGTFTEVYSGNKRILATCCSDFNGIDIFYVKSQDIVNNIIHMKFYGRGCKPVRKKFKIKNDLKTTIYLEYGKTEYNTKTEDFNMMFKKLNIKDQGSLDD